jgi:UDP-glucose 4-epimerase
MVCEAVRTLKAVDRPILSVVWAAGRAGFQSGDSVHRLEFENFHQVLSIGTRVALQTPKCQVRFFLVSSAGGLYEGQRNVSSSTFAVPLRAYGRFKLMQEEALRQAEGYYASFVYRPSTIYGLALKGRVGLVYALLLNGVRHRVTTISGNATTLRDFVFNWDLGRFIADEILSLTETEAPPRFLVSGKPSSIQEIVTIAEDLLGRKLYLSYSTEPQNALHNTYAPHTTAKGWRSTPLKEGMQSILRGLLTARPCHANH